MSQDVGKNRDEVVETYLRHLLRGDERPDISGFDATERAELENIFNLLDAIAGMDPNLVPDLENDPVVKALGLKPSSPFAPETDGRLTRVMEEIEGWNPDAIVIPDDEASRYTARSNLLLRVSDTRIRIVVVDRPELSALADLLIEADRLFYRFLDTAAVALVSLDEDLLCQVLEPEDCRPAIETPLGNWKDPRPRRPQLPLRSALTGYLEDIEPVWDRPESAVGTVWRDVDLKVGVEEISRSVIERLKKEGSGPRIQIAPKKTAHKVLGSRETEALVSLVLGLQRGEISPDDVPRFIDKLGDAA